MLQGLKCVPIAVETCKTVYGNGPVFSKFYPDTVRVLTRGRMLISEFCTP